MGLAFTPLRRLFAGPDSTDPLDEFLLVILQRLFPHPQIPGAIYRDVAKGMALAIGNDSTLSSLVAAGRHQLDQDASAPWMKLDDIQQTMRLEAIENTAFFQTLRGMGSFSFYNNPDVWPYFGYEGSSFEKGGYLTRGFDDLDWLPAPRS